MTVREQPTNVVVRRSMNDHGTMTVELPDTNEMRYVCEYATPELRRRLESLPVGTVIPLVMFRIGVRANVWRAVSIADRRPGGTAAVESGETPTRDSMKQPL